MYAKRGILLIQKLRITDKIDSADLRIIVNQIYYLLFKTERRYLPV